MSSYERFTDRARTAMQIASKEACSLNHEYVGTEHILLGIVKEGCGVAANVLKSLGVELTAVHAEIHKLVQSGTEEIPQTRKLPLTPRAKTVIEYALDEARQLEHNYVGTEHLLLGLLREQEGVAAQVLMNLGVRLAETRTAVLELLPKSSDDRPESADSAAVVEVQVEACPTEEKEGWVYIFAMDVPTGGELRFFKVGYSTDPATRFSQISTSCPGFLWAFGVVRGDLERESLLHRMLRRFRVKGEWFCHCQTEMVDILQLLGVPDDGQSDFPSLPWTTPAHSDEWELAAERMEQVEDGDDA